MLLLRLNIIIYVVSPLLFFFIFPPLSPVRNSELNFRLVGVFAIISTISATNHQRLLPCHCCHCCQPLSAKFGTYIVCFSLFTPFFRQRFLGFLLLLASSCVGTLFHNFTIRTIHISTIQNSVVKLSEKMASSLKFSFLKFKIKSFP